MENNHAGKAADAALQNDRKINGFQVSSVGVPPSQDETRSTPGFICRIELDLKGV